VGERERKSFDELQRAEFGAFPFNPFKKDQRHVIFPTDPFIYFTHYFIFDFALGGEKLSRPSSHALLFRFDKFSPTSSGQIWSSFFRKY